LHGSLLRVASTLAEPADLATITYVPRPEWFFFSTSRCSCFFPGYALIAFGAVVATVFIVLLLAVPWLDRGLRRPRRGVLRDGYRLLVVVVVLQRTC